MLKKKIDISLFFNGLRGLNVYQFLKNTKNVNIKFIFLSKKFLNSKVPKILKKEKVNLYYYENINHSKILSVHKKLDLAFVCGFPYILKKKLIKKPHYGFFNCHAGKLPKYRGGSPLNWQIINNEKKFGLSVIKINTGIDSGNIFYKKDFLLKKRYDINNLHKIANKQFPIMVKKSLEKIISGQKGLKQNKMRAKYFKQRSSSDSEIKINQISYKQIKLMIRALKKPYPCAYFWFKNRKIIINNIEKSSMNLKPGIIVKKNKFIHFGCKKETLKTLLRIK